MKKTKIALVQMQSRVGEKDLNLEKIEEYIKVASKEESHIICFPEAVIHGYSKEGHGANPNEVEELAQIFKNWAIDYSITILVGLIEGNLKESPYIAHIVAIPHEEIEVYRKSHLGKSELEYFSNGNTLPIFKTPTANVGIQICWETHFPEISTIMALKGADIIFTPFASPINSKRRKDIWMKYLPARAYDNTVFIAACNSIGNNGKGIEFGGGALVLDPKGNLIAEDFQEKEGILFSELDPSSINNIRNEKKSSMNSRYFLKSRRPELYIDALKSF